MIEINSIVKELFENKKVNLFIGYTEDKRYDAMPIFITSTDEIGNLVFNENCKQNLATYIHKNEVKKFGKIAILANYPAIRTILQLSAENQIKEGDIILIIVPQNETPKLLEKFDDMATYVKQNPPSPTQQILEKIEEIENMNREDRWKFWIDELSSCIKCYACRSACPLCYCTQCTVECNQPQWIPNSTTAQGNFEWHLMRMMHLAGRCISCGECTRACPMEIPLTLLNAKMNQFILKTFGQKAGYSPEPDYPFNVFKTDDKENFIR